MAKNQSTKAALREDFTEADGHQLLADMLREIHEDWLAQDEARTAELDDDTLGDWRKLDVAVLRRYIETVRRKRSTALARGFYAALYEFIGQALDGVVLDSEAFEEESDGASDAARSS
jgi:hypothetical protein